MYIYENENALPNLPRFTTRFHSHRYLSPLLLVYFTKKQKKNKHSALSLKQKKALHKNFLHSGSHFALDSHIGASMKHLS